MMCALEGDAIYHHCFPECSVCKLKRITAQADGLNKLLAFYVEGYNKQLDEKDVIIARLEEEIVKAITKLNWMLAPGRTRIEAVEILKKALCLTVCVDPDCDGTPETHWKHQHGRTVKKVK